jgi:putative nucleotidyltransferase with HDIG domain
VKILEVLEDPEVPIKEIAKVIGLDPILTSNIIKLSNSVYFYQESKISSIPQAAILIGKLSLRFLTLAAYAKSLMMAKTLKAYNLGKDFLWGHNIITAMLSQILLGKYYNSHEKLDTIYLAGLLHDIGKIVLNEYIPDKYWPLFSNITEYGIEVENIERNMFDISHAELGNIILSKWKFSEQILDVVLNHHNFSLSGFEAIDYDNGKLTFNYAIKINDKIGNEEREQDILSKFVLLSNILANKFSNKKNTKEFYKLYQGAFYTLNYLDCYERIDEKKLFDTLINNLEEYKDVISKFQIAPVLEQFKIVTTGCLLFAQKFHEIFPTSYDEKEKNSNEKGKLLQELIEFLFKEINGIKIKYLNLRSAAEEIDLLIENGISNQPWLAMGNPIIVECKNWNKPIPAKEVGGLERLLNTKNIKTAILIAPEGITGNDEWKDAKLVVREMMIRGKYIIIMDYSDLKKVADGAKPTEVIEACFYKIFEW